MTATVTGPGTLWLAGWFDWDQDPAFDPAEGMVWQSVITGTYTITFAVPTDADADNTCARSRLAPNSTDVSLPTSTSNVCGGEVEDHVTDLNPIAVVLVSFTPVASRGAFFAWLWLWLAGLGALTMGGLVSMKRRRLDWIREGRGRLPLLLAQCGSHRLTRALPSLRTLWRC